MSAKRTNKMDWYAHLTGDDRKIVEAREAGKSWAEIGDELGRARQSVQRRWRTLTGQTGRQWPGRKSDSPTHTVEVRVNSKVHTAALMRLAAVCDELDLVGSSRPTLSAVCRELIRTPLDDETFPQLDEPFVTRLPGSIGGTAQVVRWRDSWATYSAAQDQIHERGYSVSQVVDARLKQFARSGQLPGKLRHYQAGDDE